MSVLRLRYGSTELMPTYLFVSAQEPKAAVRAVATAPGPRTVLVVCDDLETPGEGAFVLDDDALMRTADDLERELQVP